MPDPHVISDGQLLYANDDVEVSDPHVVVDPAFADIDDAEAKVDALADLVTEQKPVTWSHQKRRQHRNQGQHKRPKFAYSMHRGSCPWARRIQIRLFVYLTNCRVSNSAVALLTWSSGS